METHPLTARNWLIVALISLALGLWFVSPYLGVIALAALMAFLFYGTYTRLERRMRAGGAATLTFLFSLVVVLVPVSLVARTLAAEVQRHVQAWRMARQDARMWELAQYDHRLMAEIRSFRD